MIYYVPRNVQPQPSSLDRLGKFSEPALLVLASLSAKSKHGYAIIQDVELYTGKRLGPGTLYGAISRLDHLQFIEPLEMEERGRRPYRITPAGRRALQEHLRALQAYHNLLESLASR